jgi:hypothetical protein
MGFLQIAKLGTKIFLAGGVVYYSNEFGIWGNPKETEEGYARLKTVIRNNEYYQQMRNLPLQYVEDNEGLKKQLDEIKNYSVDIRSKFPEFPSSDQVGSNWNKGVETTFTFLSNSPLLVSNCAIQLQNFVGGQLKEAVVAQPQSIPEPHAKGLEEKASNEK